VTPFGRSRSCADLVEQTSRSTSDGQRGSPFAPKPGAGRTYRMTRGRERLRVATSARLLHCHTCATSSVPRGQQVDFAAPGCYHPLRLLVRPELDMKTRWTPSMRTPRCLREQAASLLLQHHQVLPECAPISATSPTTPSPAPKDRWSNPFYATLVTCWHRSVARGAGVALSIERAVGPRCGE